MGKLILAIIVVVLYLAWNAEKKETVRLQDEQQTRRESRLTNIEPTRHGEPPEELDDDFNSGIASQW